jgi:hypothetical protein
MASTPLDIVEIVIQLWRVPLDATGIVAIGVALGDGC